MGVLSVSVTAKAQAPLFEHVLVSDVGTNNNIGSANTSRNVAVDAQGNIGVVYIGSSGLRFAKSINRGRFFLPSVQISTATTGSCEVEVADNGNVYVIYSNGSQISLFASLDGGASFSGPSVLGPGAVPHIASYGSNVYVVPQSGAPVYRNSNNGVGAYSSVSFSSKVYSDIRVDKANGDVYLIQDNPTLYLYRSTNSGVSFSPVPVTGSIYYSSYSITTGPLGKYIYVAGGPLSAGASTPGYRIDLTTGVSTSIPVGNNIISEGRTLASDEFGNFIDGYATSATTVAFQVSNDLGATFGTPVTINNARSHNLARNSSTQDIDVVYTGTDGNIYLNVYNDLLTGLTISQVGQIYCPGSSGTITYSLTGGNLNSGNQFIVQLSDANRSFANPQTIGSLASAEKTGTIDVQVPVGTPFGSNYRMRVISTDPSNNGSDNGFDITVEPIPSAVVTAAGPITFCEGGSVVLAANSVNAATTYQWSTGETTRTITVTKSGDYTCKVTTPCGATISDPVTVKVNMKPDVTIVADGSTSFCEDGLVKLTATSALPIDSYLWNTGATTPSINATTAGTYSVTVSNSCGTTISAPVIITRSPTIDIVPQGPTTLCAGESVVLLAKSDGKHDTYLWNTGATTKSITVTAAGNYTVKATNICGLSTISEQQSIIVNPLPTADLTLPDICLVNGTAHFTNRSSADASQGALTYNWNFGDNNANASHPNTSNDVDPTHTYTAAGTYPVTLTATTANGCSASITKSFVVSGSIPKADFNILSTNTLCSDQKVVFNETSTIAFGELTRIEWYFDIDDHPADPLYQYVDNAPNLRADVPKEYSFTYPVFHLPLSKTVNVRMRAFSGLVCVSEITKPLILKAVPDVAFSPLSNICAEKHPIQITQASEVSGMSGIGVFSGDGVTSSGIFDPLSAGVGLHTISYTFTGSNGCITQKSQTIEVYPTPTVNAGEDVRILLDDEIKLNPITSGNNLTYKWFPSAGLDRDDIKNPVASPRDDITYTLTVTSSEGCTATDDIFIKVLKIPEVPNTFTPNGDGVNDTWVVKYLDAYPNATIDIFNRYGAKVYTAKGFLSPWDGRSNGADLPVGTYYYMISPGLGRKTIAGFVTIVK